MHLDPLDVLAFAVVLVTVAVVAWPLRPRRRPRPRGRHAPKG